MERTKTLLVAILVSLGWLRHQVHGYQVLVSLNTYKKQSVNGALSRVAELKCDGAWFITMNSDFSDEEWKFIFETLDGRHVSEDNPDGNKSYLDYVRIIGKSPAASFCYNETGGLPGGTQLTDEQIQLQYESHGKKPIVCLTRSYGGLWMTETDRCLRNPKVAGICMEYVKKALLEDINAPAACIKAIRKRNKPVYILLHAEDDGWTLEENRKIIANLNKWCPKEMASDEVYLVYQDYGGDTDAWFGPGGVKEAIRQACDMPSYSGSRNKKRESGQFANGDWIAVQGKDPNHNLQIFLVHPDGTGRHQLTFKGDNGTPSWSPDGERIAFSSNRSGNDAIYTMDSDGTNQMLLIDGAAFPDWSTQNEIAYFSNDGLIWAVKPDGSKKRQLTFRSKPRTATGHPSWSPDGNKLTFVYITRDPSSPAGFNPEIWCIDRDGSNMRLVTMTDPDNTRPDGSFLNTAHDANAPDFGPDGWIAFWSGEENSWGQVWKIRDYGGQRIQLTSTDFLSRNDDPTWSPDGTKILFSTDRNRGNEVWIMDSDGSNPTYVTKNAAGPYPGDPAWQPVSR